MRMTNENLKATSDQQLVENFQRAVELDVKNDGNGKSPFDKNQLKTELLDRLEKRTLANVAESNANASCY